MNDYYSFIEGAKPKLHSLEQQTHCRQLTFPLCASESLLLGFERGSIHAVLSLFGAGFAVKRLAQDFAFDRNGVAEQGAEAGMSVSLIDKTPTQTNEALGRSGFSQPKGNASCRRLAAQSSTMGLDQGIDPQPIPFALRLLRLDQFLEGKQFEGLTLLVANRRPSGPQDREIR
jgi:hypothetical protein